MHSSLSRSQILIEASCEAVAMRLSSGCTARAENIRLVRQKIASGREAHPRPFEKRMLPSRWAADDLRGVLCKPATVHGAAKLFVFRLL